MSSVIEDFTCIFFKLHVPKSGIENYKNSKHVQINSDYQGIYK